MPKLTKRTIDAVEPQTTDSSSGMRASLASGCA